LGKSNSKLSQILEVLSNRDVEVGVKLYPAILTRI